MPSIFELNRACQYRSFYQQASPLLKCFLLLCSSIPQLSYGHVCFFASNDGSLKSLKSQKSIHPSHPSTVIARSFLLLFHDIPILDVVYLQCGDERRFVTACGGRFPSSYWSGSLLSAQLSTDRNGENLWLPVRHSYWWSRLRSHIWWMQTDKENHQTQAIHCHLIIWILDTFFCNTIQCVRSVLNRHSSLSAESHHIGLWVS